MFAGIGRYSDPRIAAYALIALGVLAGLLLYFPIALAHELRRRSRHDNPDWMGDAGGRRRRLAVIGCVLAVAATVAGLFAALAG